MWPLVKRNSLYFKLRDRQCLNPLCRLALARGLRVTPARRCHAANRVSTLDELMTFSYSRLIRQVPIRYALKPRHLENIASAINFKTRPAPNMVSSALGVHSQAHTYAQVPNGRRASRPHFLRTSLCRPDFVPSVLDAKSPQEHSQLARHGHNGLLLHAMLRYQTIIQHSGARVLCFKLPGRLHQQPTQHSLRLQAANDLTRCLDRSAEPWGQAPGSL